jgi:HK97 family phage portal protein
MIAEALQNTSFTLRSITNAGSKYAGINALLGTFGLSSTQTVVNQKSALTLSAVYNAVTIICNDVAKLPKGVYQKSPDGKTRQQIQHPVKHLIAKQPNQYMNAFQFDFITTLDAIMRGNGYAIIERNKITAQPMALQYVDQDQQKVEVYKYNNKLYYKIDKEVYDADDILHFTGFSFNGITGVGVITQAAQSLGVSLSSQKFAGDYYEDKGVGTGVLTTSKQMTDDAKTRYSQALSEMFEKKAKWVVPVIDESSHFEHLKITPQEAQFLLSSEHGINEVARWFNINPVKLKHLKDTNNAISESLEREHVSDSLMPWVIKRQQEYDRKLFSEREINAGIYTKFNTDALLTADKVAQSDAWMKQIYSGIITPNEVRAYKDMNPLEGLDQPLIPANLQTLEQVAAKLKLTETQTQAQNEK